MRFILFKRYELITPISSSSYYYYYNRDSISIDIEIGNVTYLTPRSLGIYSHRPSLVVTQHTSIDLKNNYDFSDGG